LPVRYKNLTIEAGYRIDLLVGGLVIVELKSVDKVHPVHEAQLITYLRLSGNRVGLLINFNVKLLRDGLKRLIVD
jgi:GxxExxY protein